MDKQEFDRLVDFVEQELDISKGVLFAEGYDNWQTRLRMARILTRNFQKYPEAIELFTSAVDSKPENIEQFEDIVWALRDLCVCVYYHEQDPAKALMYIDRAVKLIELDPGKQFTFFVRGEIWCWRWSALKELGDTATAVQEAGARLENAPPPEAGQSNSYIYYAYYFIASLAYYDGEYQVALNTLEQALVYYPLADNAVKVQDILYDAGLTDKDKYEQILQITRLEAVWDV